MSRIILILLLSCVLATFAKKEDRVPDADIMAIVNNQSDIDTDNTTQDTSVCIVVCRDTASNTCPYLKINRVYFYDQPIAIDTNGKVIQTWGEACRDTVVNDWNFWVPQITTLRLKRAKKIMEDTVYNWFVVDSTLSTAKKNGIKNTKKRWQKAFGSIKIRKEAK